MVECLTEGDRGRAAHIVAMTIIVFAFAAAFLVLVFLVSVWLYEEHRYPHQDLVLQSHSR